MATLYLNFVGQITGSIKYKRMENKNCHRCGGRIDFSIKSRTVTCPYCDQIVANEDYLKELEEEKKLQEIEKQSRKKEVDAISETNEILERIERRELKKEKEEEKRNAWGFVIFIIIFIVVGGLSLL